MHWNILAQKLTGHDKFPNVEEKLMKWSYRSTLVKKHIEDENADIVGICELDCKDNYAKVFDKNIN